MCFNAGVRFGAGAALKQITSSVKEELRQEGQRPVSFSEWATVFGDAKMTTALLDRLTHRCHILENGNDSFHFNMGSDTAAREKKEASHPVTSA